MGIEEAKIIIDIAASEKSKTLLLPYLELTTDDLEILIPLIAKTDVTNLALYNNSLHDLPESIGKLQKLTSLHIESKTLKTLPKSTGKLQNLTKLQVSGHNFTTLPESTGELKNLTELYISGHNFTTLPESTGELKNLTELQVIGENFMVIPKLIGKLQNLERLCIYGDYFPFLPECIGTLNKLTEIIVSGGRLENIPQSIGNLPNLRRFIILNSAISEIPETLAHSQNIQEIKLINCPLFVETMTWLDRTFPEGIVTYSSRATRSPYQSAKEVLQFLYTNLYERASVMENLENSDLDSRNITYRGGSQTQLKTLKEIIIEFLNKVQIHNRNDLEVYGSPIKSILDSILNQERFNRDERTNNLATLTIRMGDSSTAIREELIQEAAKLHPKSIGTLPKTNQQAVIEREMFKNALSKLEGYRANDQIEQLNGLLNALYLDRAEENPRNQNIRIIGDRIRLPSVTAYPDFAFQLVQNNATLIKNFACMVCHTDPHNQPVLYNGTYRLDINKIKKINDNYSAELISRTRQQRAIQWSLNIYPQKMIEFFNKKEETLVNEHSQGAENLLDITSHTKESQELTEKQNTKEDRNKAYEKFSSQKKSEIEIFTNEKKNQKPILNRLTVPVNEKAAPPTKKHRPIR
ncbi:leucine-rich repeat domain-containing protein [Flavobacterium poyangense]|uniref:leucine-rich repeat domain-containing protein n=1 Tax=Flavobacterium poyangense TaxID=2204302 RepID=UPI001424968C|nr:leucine-rich repeat domain-containing protein [Flavobacterium sp. JXAS1]